MAREATATRVCGASRPRAPRGIASTGSRCAAVPWRSWRRRGALSQPSARVSERQGQADREHGAVGTAPGVERRGRAARLPVELSGLGGQRPIILARWRRLHWRTGSAARSRQPTGARTCSSVGAGSWMTGPATWPAGVEGPDRSVDRPWPRQLSMAFPPGTTVEGATPKRGGEVVDFGVHHLPLPGAAPAAKNPGSLPPLPPPPVRLHDAPGTRRPPSRHGCRSRRGESAPTRLQ